jgi:hypothetical protein
MHVHVVVAEIGHALTSTQVATGDWPEFSRLLQEYSRHG